MKFREWINLLCLAGGSLKVVLDCVTLASAKHELYLYWLSRLPFFS